MGILLIFTAFITLANSQGTKFSYEPSKGNWAYLINAPDKMDSKTEEAILNFAAGCDVRPAAKARSGKLSHITLDLLRTPPELIRRLQAQGTQVICYFSGGSLNDWRPEDEQWIKKFKTSGDLGPPVKKSAEGSERKQCDRKHARTSDGEKLKDNVCYWSGNFWLLPSASETMKEYLDARMKEASDRGCSGVEPDNVDAFTQPELKGRTSYKKGIAFIKAIAESAHKYQMGFGLKNAGSVAKQVSSVSDFSVNEQMGTYPDDKALVTKAFPPQSRKPIFAVDYDNVPAAKGENIMGLSLGNQDMDSILPSIVSQCGRSQTSQVKSKAAVK